MRALPLCPLLLLSLSSCPAPVVTDDGDLASLPAPMGLDLARIEAGAPDGAAPPPPWFSLCGPSGFCWDNPRPQGNDLHALWSDPRGRLVAVGELGTALHFDGAAWSLQLTGTARPLRAIHGRAATELFAAGERGVVLRHDGAIWQALGSGTTQDLSGVYQSPQGEVWAVGAQGTLRRFSGGAWQDFSGVTSDDLTAVSGRDARDVWTVGARGALLRFGGAAWKVERSAGGGPLFATWGNQDPNSPSELKELWAVGAGVLRWPSGGVGAPDPNAMPWYGVWGNSAIDLFTVSDDSIFNFDGQTWTRVLRLGSAATVPLFAAVAGSSRDVFVAGLGGLLLHLAGERFVPFFPELSTQHLSAVSGSAADDVYAVGYGGAVLRWNGAAWRALRAPTALVLNSVWSDGGGVSYAVGSSGLILRIQGEAVQQVASGLTMVDLRAVHGSAPDDVWAVGRSATILHFDGQRWSLVARGPGADLNAVWASGRALAFLAGAGGTLLRWDGQTFTTESKVTLQDLYAIHGASPTRVWAGGTSGALLAFDGQRWSPQVSGTRQIITGLHGNAAGQVFAVGDTNGNDQEESLVLRLDGEGWTPLPTGTNNRLAGLWVAADGAVIVVGSLGTILRRRP